MRKIYLIHARAQSGKDTCANAIKRYCKQSEKKDTLIISFADTVRWTLAQYYNVTEYKTEAGRSFIQYYATDKCRGNDPELWARWVATYINAVQDDWDNVVIPDWRFYNEADMLEKMFPDKVVHVLLTRSDIDGIDHMTEEQREHASESELNTYTNWDYVIHNETGKFDETMTQLCAMLEKEEPHDKN